MKEGSVLHEDFRGHKGEIGPGDVQWMTAGKGIVHSEIPKSKDEYSIGFQLWINLKKEFKLCEPTYQEFLSESIPVYEEEGKWIWVISGQIGEIKGPIFARQPTEYYDFVLTKSSHEFQFQPEWNSLIFIYDGELKIQQDKEIKTYAKETAVVFDPHSEGTTIFSTDSEAKFILITGEAIKEPKVNHGPFVMNTYAEILQA